MFWLIVRALILVAVGGFIALITSWAAAPFIDILFVFQTGESQNAYWIEQTITWLPGIMLGSIAIMVFSGAAAQRGGI